MLRAAPLRRGAWAQSNAYCCRGLSGQYVGERSLHGTASQPHSSPVPHIVSSTIDESEARHFRSLAQEWWSPRGPFAPLHSMTPLRAEFVTSSVCASLSLDARAARPLEGVRILDVGCGGGILAEALAKRGARVTGVDVVEESLGVARAHAAEDERVRDRVAYYAASIEQVGAAVDAGRQRGQDGLGSAASVGFSDARPLPPAMLPFDAVVASEVMEHVENLPTFAAALSASAAPQAPVVVTTLNRTLPSYLAAIVLAERVLRWVPRGTHRWERFLTPEELAMLMRAHGRMRMEGATGMLLDPLAKTWRFGTDLSINYAAHFVKMD